MTQTEVAEIIRGLHGLADWMDQHKEWAEALHVSIYAAADPDRAKLKGLIDALGPTKRNVVAPYVVIERDFGGHVAIVVRTGVPKTENE